MGKEIISYNGNIYDGNDNNKGKNTNRSNYFQDI